MKAWVSAKLVLASCTISKSTSYGYCYQYAYSEIYGYVYLYDKTTGSYVAPSSWWSGFFKGAYTTEHHCYNGSCSNYQSLSTGPSQMSSSFQLVDQKKYLDQPVGQLRRWSSTTLRIFQRRFYLVRRDDELREHFGGR